MYRQIVKDRDLIRDGLHERQLNYGLFWVCHGTIKESIFWKQFEIKSL